MSVQSRRKFASTICPQPNFLASASVNINLPAPICLTTKIRFGLVIIFPHTYDKIITNLD